MLLGLVLSHWHRFPFILFTHNVNLLSRSFIKKYGFKSHILDLNITNLYETVLIEVSLNLWSFPVSILVASLSHNLSGARSGTSDAHSSPETERLLFQEAVQVNILSLKFTKSDAFILWDSAESPKMKHRSIYPVFTLSKPNF